MVFGRQGRAIVGNNVDCWYATPHPWVSVHCIHIRERDFVPAPPPKHRSADADAGVCAASRTILPIIFPLLSWRPWQLATKDCMPRYSMVRSSTEYLLGSRPRMTPKPRPWWS